MMPKGRGSVNAARLEGPIETLLETYDALAVASPLGVSPGRPSAAAAFFASGGSSYISGSTMLIDASWNATKGPTTGWKCLRS